LRQPCAAVLLGRPELGDRGRCRDRDGRRAAACRVPTRERPPVAPHATGQTSPPSATRPARQASCRLPQQPCCLREYRHAPAGRPSLAWSSPVTFCRPSVFTVRGGAGWASEAIGPLPAGRWANMGQSLQRLRATLARGASAMAGNCARSIPPGRPAHAPSRLNAGAHWSLAARPSGGAAQSQTEPQAREAKEWRVAKHAVVIAGR
jgi:hypothetical protein